MPRFAYQAATTGGEIVEGEMDAADRANVVERLQDSGYFPISAEEVAARGPTLSFDLARLFAPRVNAREITTLTRELATMLNAGLALDHALAVLAKLTSNTALRALLDQVRGDIEAGASFSEALVAHPRTFSPFFINMVRAGESSGLLEATLDRLADYEERAQRLRESVRSAMVYPALLMVIAGISLLVLLTYVVPQFEPLFEDMGASLPLSTQVVVGIARTLQTWWWALPIVALALVWGVRRALQDPETRRVWDSLILRTPVLASTVSKIEMARFSRTLGTLLGNGVPVLAGLGIVAETLQNTVLRQATVHVTNNLEQGKGLGKPMAEAGVFPELAVQLIQVGEDTGQLDTMLLKLADIYDDDVERAVKRLLTLLEPILILGMGAIIAFIIISILLAILSLNEFAI